MATALGDSRFLRKLVELSIVVLEEETVGNFLLEQQTWGMERGKLPPMAGKLPPKSLARVHLPLARAIGEHWAHPEEQKTQG